jgi:hypothetical protein
MEKADACCVQSNTAATAVTTETRRMDVTPNQAATLAHARRQNCDVRATFLKDRRAGYSPGPHGASAAFAESCLARTGGRRSGRACLLRPGISDVNSFRYCQGVIYFDAQISTPRNRHSRRCRHVSMVPEHYKRHHGRQLRRPYFSRCLSGEMPEYRLRGRERRPFLGFEPLVCADDAISLSSDSRSTVSRGP